MGSGIVSCDQFVYGTLAQGAITDNKGSSELSLFRYSTCCAIAMVLLLQLDGKIGDTAGNQRELSRYLSLFSVDRKSVV